MRIVSVSKVVPFEGIPHAGGEYYRRHVNALRDLGHDVVILAPRDGRNIDALPHLRRDVDAILVGRSRRRFLARVTDRLHSELNPATMPPRFASALRTHPGAIAAITSADLIEVQWTEMMSTLTAGAPIPGVGRPILIAHDVLAQRESRMLASTPRWKVLIRAHRRFRLGRVVRREAALLRSARAVITLSDKDAALVQGLVDRSTSVHAVAPPLWDSSRDPIRRRPTDDDVIMVGAFNRRENANAAEWLLRKVWPQVLATRPNARLTLVGSRPSRRLTRQVERTPNVALSGYVDSLEPFYGSAAVAVVPLLSGAGIKFKTIDALVRGVPIVSTSVGAEGIVDEDGRHPFDVHDDPTAFASAILRYLAGHGVDSAQTTGEWARGRYGTESFAHQIHALIGEVSRDDGGDHMVTDDNPSLPGGGAS